ncbi:uncharacterized protein LOC129741814 [Uranotaenia lowii]|uniref:uncharacterized protein LOC129741814 n=1 Tax=Uranotaenia lowii TaxID=190385 RepID=UPI002479885F|nr:uncharacterized protein LOC129741814 [Uranotaenia lowii]
MRSRSLRLAHHKTEVLLITNLISAQTGTIPAGPPYAIYFKRANKHLGVMIKLAEYYEPFRLRLQKSGNGDGSPLAGHYGAAALSRQCNLQKLCSVQRLRVISAFRTVSSIATDIMAVFVPISVLLEEDIFCYEYRHMPNVRKHVREASMSSWQHQ